MNRSSDHEFFYWDTPASRKLMRALMREQEALVPGFCEAKGRLPEAMLRWAQEERDEALRELSFEMRESAAAYLSRTKPGSM